MHFHADAKNEWMMEWSLTTPQLMGSAVLKYKARGVPTTRGPPTQLKTLNLISMLMVPLHIGKNHRTVKNAF